MLAATSITTTTTMIMRMTTRTRTAMATITTETAALRLQAWLSPAFPVGGFAWSQGIETAVADETIRDTDTLRDWVHDMLVHGSGRNDAILLRLAHAAEPEALDDLAGLARATATGAERLAETVGQGNAFRRAAAAWGAASLEAVTGDLPYPVAIGALARAHGIAADAATAAFLQALAATLISAAVRLVPLGQSQGLAVLAALEPSIIAVAAGTRGATEDDIGGATFIADIGALRHETLETRLFRS
jgi:urease accessory protein